MYPIRVSQSYLMRFVKSKMFQILRHENNVYLGILSYRLSVFPKNLPRHLQA